MRILCLSAAMLALAAIPGAQQPVPAPAAPGWQAPPPTPGAISPQESAYKQDAVEFTLAPNEGMEYKYRLEKGQGFVYSWKASAPVHFEMHSVPDGAPSTFAETFEKLDDRPAGHGSYVAPFSGIHGWYWQNRTKEPVTLTFTAAGFFTNSQEFRRGVPPKVKQF
jgi:hypothetical protein